MIELKNITTDNYQDVLNLHASVPNDSFVDTVVYSMAEAWVYYTDTRLFAIYHDDIMVGFVSMYVGEKHYQIINFFIDDAFCGLGFGKQAALLCIDYLKDTFQATMVSLPVKLEHKAAQNFWEKLGFYLSDTIEGEYVFMRKML